MSNLLDKASIILTPTAYNNGEALCVKPSDGSGDFDFSRNSAATRVNAQGLVENVQILSSNLVQNGDFSEEGSEEVSNGSFSQEGVELVTNGDFATDSDWGKINATISGGTGNLNGTGVTSMLYQDVLTNGSTYKATFTISNYNSIGISDIIDAAGAPIYVINSNGTFTITFTHTNASGNIYWRARNSAIFEIDNVSVREVGQDWDLGTGWSIGEDKAVHTGAQSLIGQTNILTIGKSYKITFDLSGADNSNYARLLSSQYPNGGNYTSDGTITVYTTTNIDDLYIYGVGDISITNISVKEVGQNWTVGSDWSIAENKAVSSGSGNNLQQTINILSNKTYKLTFDVISTSGTLAFDLGGATAKTLTDSGSKEYYFQSVNTNNLRFYGGAYYGSITNISVIEITDDTSLPRINYEGFSYQDALGSELVTNGSFDTDSSWAKGTGWSISGGSANCDGTQTSPTNLIQNNLALGTNKIFKIEFEVKDYQAGELIYVNLTGTGILEFENVNANGTYVAYSGLSTGDNFITFRADSNFIGSIDNVSVKEYLGQEVVPDSGCGSWLFEPQSTNLVTQSELFSDASWIKTNSSVVSGFASPDGLTNAFKLVENTSNSYHLVTSSTFTSGSYTSSIYAKADERGYVMIWNSGANSGRIFDLINGTLGGVLGATPLHSKIDYVGNGWYRCSVSNNNATTLGVYLAQSSTSSFYQGDGVSGIYIWGAQLEQQSYATSYIPTEGSTVTRNQDVCTNGGSLASINSTEGVLYAEIAALADDETNREITLSDGTTSNYVLIRFNSGGSNRIYTRVNVGGAIQYFDLEFSIDITNTTKIAIRYGDNNFATFINGSKVKGQLSGSTFPSNTLTEVAFDNGGGGANFFGKTKAVAVWKEALSDEELTELTTI